LFPLSESPLKRNLVLLLQEVDSSRHFPSPLDDVGSPPFFYRPFRCAGRRLSPPALPPPFLLFRSFRKNPARLSGPFFSSYLVLAIVIVTNFFPFPPPFNAYETELRASFLLSSLSTAARYSDRVFIFPFPTPWRTTATASSSLFLSIVGQQTSRLSFFFFPSASHRADSERRNGPPFFLFGNLRQVDGDHSNFLSPLLPEYARQTARAQRFSLLLAAAGNHSVGSRSLKFFLLSKENERVLSHPCLYLAEGFPFFSFLSSPAGPNKEKALIFLLP